jgi:hypothetical protein
MGKGGRGGFAPGRFWTAVSICRFCPVGESSWQVVFRVGVGATGIVRGGHHPMVVCVPKLFLPGGLVRGEGRSEAIAKDAKERKRETDNRCVSSAAAHFSDGRLESRGFAISRFRGCTMITRLSVARAQLIRAGSWSARFDFSDSGHFHLFPFFHLFAPPRGKELFAIVVGGEWCIEGLGLGSSVLGDMGAQWS